MRIVLRAAFAAALVAAGPIEAQAADSAALLTPSRIAALPAEERQAWERYVETSRRVDGGGEPITAERIQSLASTGRANACRSPSSAFARAVDARDWMRSAVMGSPPPSIRRDVST